MTRKESVNMRKPIGVAAGTYASTSCLIHEQEGAIAAAVPEAA